MRPDGLSRLAALPPTTVPRVREPLGSGIRPRGRGATSPPDSAPGIGGSFRGWQHRRPSCQWHLLRGGASRTPPLWLITLRTIQAPQRGGAGPATPRRWSCDVGSTATPPPPGAHRRRIHTFGDRRAGAGANSGTPVILRVGRTSRNVVLICSALDPEKASIAEEASQPGGFPSCRVCPPQTRLELEYRRVGPTRGEQCRPHTASESADRHSLLCKGHDARFLVVCRASCSVASRVGQLLALRPRCSTAVDSICRHYEIAAGRTAGPARGSLASVSHQFPRLHTLPR